MNSEERFRRSLEELVNSRDFTFDQDNWEKARQMIDASKKRKRRIAPFLFAGILLLSSLLTGIYFLQDSSVTAGEKLVEVPAKELKTTPEPSAAENTRMSTPVPPPVEKPLDQTPALQDKQTAKAPEPSFSANEPLPTAPSPLNTEPVLPEVKASPEDMPVAYTETPANSTTLPEPDKAILPPTDKQAEVILENVSAAAVANVAADKNPPEKIKEQVTSPVVIVPVDAAAITISSEQPGEDLPPAGSQAASDLLQADPGKTDPSKNEIKPADLQTSAPSFEDLAKKPEEPLKAVSPDSIKIASDKIQDLLPADNDQGQLGKPKEVIVLFSVEAGANYMYGWKNPGGNDANGFNPLIGVNWFNNFKPGMSLSLGLQYSTVGRLSYSNYTSRVVRRALGEESSVTVFTPIKIHYLTAPLRFNYTLNAMNTVGIGCNVAYLLNVESEVETYTEKLNTVSDYDLTKTVGYTKGFKQYDTQISAFYKRRLYPNLAVNLEVFFGLTDIKDNTFFNSNVFERNSGLKLTLVYNFLKK